VLLHEAVGHGLEGDFNRKGTSAFSGRIGQRVAAPGVTVIDDGTLLGVGGAGGAARSASMTKARPRRKTC
jgi:TldD protein